MGFIRRVILIGAAVLLAGAAAAQDEGEAPFQPPKWFDKHPCDGVINCDCESIDAGLLNIGWIPDCQNCQKGLIEACMEAYVGQPLNRAVVAGGYCDTSCSVTGPNPTPVAPEPVSAPDTGTPEPAAMTLRCDFDGEYTVLDDAGGITAAGCVDANGRRDGLWVVQDGEGRVIAEVYYEAGAERWRRDYQPG